MNKLNKLAHFRSQSGFALVVGLIMLILVAFVGMSALRTSDTDVDITANQVRRTKAFYLAEAGSEKVASDIIKSFERFGRAPDPLPSGAFDFADGYSSYSSQDLGPAAIQNLTTGAYAGLYGLVKSFGITSVGRNTADPQQVEISLVVEDALVPVFQFAVFYQQDMEFHPGPDMTITGRMHSNGDMYLGAGATLNIDSYVTAAGNIIAGRKAGSGQTYGTGQVNIKDKDGNYVGMKSGSDWLDASDTNWVNESLNRWDGHVEDHNHGISQLNLPVVTAGPGTDLIDRENAGSNPDSFENKADLKIINGQAMYHSGGSWSNVTASLTAAGALSTATFYNARESKWVTATNIDVAKLGSTSYFPQNGIIYAARDQVSGTEQAVRMTNAATLPAAMTLASPNPVYTKGDYNTNSKKPSAVLADAYTILSNNWDDTKSSQALANRNASDTKVNLAFLTGNTVTGQGGAQYNGGLENLPRLLETWNGDKLTLRGSFVDLWQSRQATGAWAYGGYYEAPTRDWGFDTDFLDPNKLPPGTPQVNVAQKTSWRQNLADLAH
jgi:hypothetical protein